MFRECYKGGEDPVSHHSGNCPERASREGWQGPCGVRSEPRQALSHLGMG